MGTKPVLKAFRYSLCILPLFLRALDDQLVAFHSSLHLCVVGKLKLQGGLAIMMNMKKRMWLQVTLHDKTYITFLASASTKDSQKQHFDINRKQNPCYIDLKERESFENVISNMRQTLCVSDDVNKMSHWKNTIWLWPFLRSLCYETFRKCCSVATWHCRNPSAARRAAISAFVLSPFSDANRQIYDSRPPDGKHWADFTPPLVVCTVTLTHSCFLPCWPAVEGAIRVLLGDGCVWEAERGGIQCGPGRLQQLAGQCPLCPCVCICLVENQKHNQLPRPSLHEKEFDWQQCGTQWRSKVGISIK